MSSTEEKPTLTERLKASIVGSGVLNNLRKLTYSDAPAADRDDLDELKQQAQTAIENIQQLLDSGKLDDGTSQKLTSALAKLKTALGKDTISRAALAIALSEAATVINSVDGDIRSAALQKMEAKLWAKVEADNKDIDDDFTKMRKAGIAFNDNLWNKHAQLTEYLQTHPHDMAKQKELDAVDDALLMQAKPQLEQHPDAKSPFDDATKKSKDRHQLVDHALATKSLANIAFDDDTEVAKHGQGENLTMNDVVPPTTGQKILNKIFVQKQTNVCFRTKPTSSRCFLPLAEQAIC